jgi:hypothetical protein
MPLRKIAFTLAALAAGLSACANEPAVTKRELTRREKDSIIGASQIPGARGVKKALSAADSAAARQARLDSAEQEP